MVEILRNTALLQRRYLYENFPEHMRWCWQYSVGARSRFRWKLHPSSQAWPLLSTSNRGETAIAKCRNLGPLKPLHWPYPKGIRPLSWPHLGSRHRYKTPNCYLAHGTMCQHCFKMRFSGEAVLNQTHFLLWNVHFMPVPQFVVPFNTLVKN